MEQRVTRLEVIAEDLRNDTHSIREEMREMRAEIRQEMRDMREEFRADFKSVRKEIWIAALTVIGISAGAMYGIVQTTIAAIDTGRASAQAQQQAAPPIIINVPPAPSQPKR